MSLAPPSRNPTVDGRLRTVLKFCFDKLIQSSLDDMLPAKVIAYDRTTNTATVQPQISMVTTLNEIVPRDQIASVPVLQLGGGGFVLNFPLLPGDLGWIKANDRDISFFTQLWRMVTPNTGRMHSFEDGVFIPNVLNNFTITDADSSRVVLQADDASVRLSMGAGTLFAIDESGESGSENAVLDVQSTTKAFGLPRMTKGQRDAIPSPRGGMMVYCTDLPGISAYTDGVGWSG